MKPAQLRLKNGLTFSGSCPSWQNENYSGEVVFTTGMTGYPESLTDPSYTGQILTFTFPLIGNYGIPDKEQWESKKIHAAGVVVGQHCENWSHHSGLHSLGEWLQAQKVPLLTGVDTRAVAKTLRYHGTLLGSIVCDPNQKVSLQDPNLEHLVSRACVSEKQSWEESDLRDRLRNERKHHAVSAKLSGDGPSRTLSLRLHRSAVRRGVYFQRSGRSDAQISRTTGCLFPTVRAIRCNARKLCQSCKK